MILYTFQKNGRENVGIFIEISIDCQMGLSNECIEKTTLEELGGVYMGMAAPAPHSGPLLAFDLFFNGVIEYLRKKLGEKNLEKLRDENSLIGHDLQNPAPYYD